jgi:hypothetical protein
MSRLIREIIVTFINSEDVNRIILADEQKPLNYKLSCDCLCYHHMLGLNMNLHDDIFNAAIKHINNCTEQILYCEYFTL